MSCAIVQSCSGTEREREREGGGDELCYSPVLLWDGERERERERGGGMSCAIVQSCSGTVD